MSKLKEQTKVRLWIVVILIFAVIMGVVDYPKYVDKSIDWFNAKAGTQISHVYNLPFHLGLDLQGGTHLVYEADVSEISSDEQSSSVEGVRDVIERRVNTLGVAEPVIQVNQARGKWRVIVELAGIQDVNEAIKMIGETPLLEFKEQNNEPPRELTAEESAELESYNEAAYKKASELLAKATGGEDFTALVKEYSEDELTKSFDGEIGYVGSANLDYTEIFKQVNELAPESGQVIETLIEDSEGYNVIKVLDVRDGEPEVKASHLLICYEGKKYCESGLTQEEARQKISDLKEQATTDNFEDLIVENSTEPNVETTKGDLNWFSKGMMVEEFENTVFAMQVGEISDIIETEFGYHLIFKTDERKLPEYKLARILIMTKSETDILPPTDQWINTGLSGKQLKKSLVEFDPNTNEPQVGLEFNDEGKELFAEITERNIGQPVAIFLDGQPISVPRVNDVIREGKAVISGSFDLAEARLLSQRLNAGALPVPINLVSQQTVGASLGAKSLQQSLWAGLLGIFLLIIFMIVYYRLPGILAIIALVVYSSILLFIFKLVPITLTLSGIAGFVLSLGMAVDANVLIFERLKEELRIGKPLGSAIDEGFKRAWPSIRDGNVSTLITCFILAWFGTSIIQGFAVTLGIGILISMFSAILVTRMLLKLFVNMKDVKSKLALFGVKKSTTEENK